MKRDRETSDENAMRQYLLGLLSEPEQSRIEEEVFADEAFYAQLCGIEDDLIDSYVRDKLSPQDREPFENHFLTSPRRRARVEFARAWRDSVAGTSKRDLKASTGSWWSAVVHRLPVRRKAALSWAAAAGLLLALGVTFYLQRERIHRLEQARDLYHGQLQEQIERAQQQSRQGLEPPTGKTPVVSQLNTKLERAEAERRRLENELARLQQAPKLLSFVLRPGLLRDENGPKRVRIPEEARVVQMELELETEQQPGSYEAVLKTLDGVEIWSQNRLAAFRNGPNRTVVLTLASRLLRPGDYHIVLYRIVSSGEREEVDDYFFRVVKT